jgi:hypothetical protein
VFMDRNTDNGFGIYGPFYGLAISDSKIRVANNALIL